MASEDFYAAVKHRLDAWQPHPPVLLAALSGGLDSCVLLHVLHRYATENGLRLEAVHVHHGLSAHADRWSTFCAELSAALGVPLHLERVDVPRDSGEGIEAAARRLRYGVFERLPHERIFLAHHADDQAETLLFNLLRGAGVRGAAGMLPLAGRYARPLLDMERAQIAGYAEANALRWVEDDSNADIRYSRNYLRQAVFPLLRERFPAAGKRLAAAAANFAEAQQLLDELAESDAAGHTDFPVPVAALARLSPARGKNLLRYLIARCGIQAPPASKLEEALRQFIEAAPDRHPALEFGGCKLYRRQGLLHFSVSATDC